jgi:hypothetical protein
MSRRVVSFKNKKIVFIPLSFKSWFRHLRFLPLATTSANLSPMCIAFLTQYLSS